MFKSILFIHLGHVYTSECIRNIWRPYSEVAHWVPSDSADLGWGLKMFISDMFPGALCWWLGTTLWKPVSQTNPAAGRSRSPPYQPSLRGNNFDKIYILYLKKEKQAELRANDSLELCLCYTHQASSYQVKRGRYHLEDLIVKPSLLVEMRLKEHEFSVQISASPTIRASQEGGNTLRGRCSIHGSSSPLSKPTGKEQATQM